MTGRAAIDLPEVLRGWAARPSAWRRHVHHDPTERTFALLHRDEEVELYVMCWMEGHDTGFHDHDESAASVLVVEGSVREDRLALGGQLGVTLTPGEAIEVPPDAIHRISHAGHIPAITLHAYSPPLARVGEYVVTTDGALVRRPRGAEVPLQAAV